MQREDRVDSVATICLVAQRRWYLACGGPSGPKLMWQIPTPAFESARNGYSKPVGPTKTLRYGSVRKRFERSVQDQDYSETPY
jgi:hypothetical protein